MLRRLIHATAVFALCFSPALGATPPVARVAPVTDTYFGDRVVDPYRWMEARGPEFDTWVRAQDSVTHQELTSAPGYAALAHDVAALSASNEPAFSLSLAGDTLFYERRPAGAGQVRLFVRHLPGGAERLLVDPEAAPLGRQGGSITTYTASPDGRTVAVALSRGGSEEAVLRILTVATGAVMPETIDRARFASPEWDPSGTAFYYDRLQAPFAGMTQAQRFDNEAIYRHVVNTDPATDRAVFAIAGKGAHGELGPSSIPDLIIPIGSHWAFALVNSGVSREGAWWIAPTASLSQPDPPWVRLAGSEAKLVQTANGGNSNVRPAVFGDQAYLITFKDAERSQLVRIDLRSPATPPKIVVPQATGVLQTMTADRSHVYLTYATGGVYQIVSYDVATGRSRSVPLPFAGTVLEAAADPQRQGAVYALTSWARPIQVYALDAALRSTPLPLSPPFQRDVSAYVGERLTASAPDGTQIPLTVVHRRDRRRDGTAPAIVIGYGAYGDSLDPAFLSRFLAFMDRGGVIGFVNVRGGGEYGEAWHVAGQKARKPNTWRDFIAGVQAIEQPGSQPAWSAPAKLTGWGTSAGGILISRAVTERPDLFGGAVMNVPMVDMLRFELSEGGPANTAEFGTLADAADYAALREMSGYQHVVDGTRYPATLITIGMNDHRVPPWMGAKMAARLQAAQATGGAPIRLRASFSEGHGIGATKADGDALSTDIIAFALRTAGDPQFQPVSPAH